MNNAVLAQFQKQAWAMEPSALSALVLRLAEISQSPLVSVNVGKTEATLRVENGVAVIPIKGVLMNEVPSFFRWFGIEATSYNDIRNQVNKAVGEKKIRSILLDVDSPGGEVGGVLETADVIVNAREKKKVTAQVGDIGFSGAYWLLSQAKQIITGANSGVGSIGVYTVFADFSKNAESAGVKVHVIRSGDLKGMGVLGAEISAGQIDNMQKYINGLAENFIKSVANGRGKPVGEVREWATGQIWIAKEAKLLGLVDKIRNASSLTNKNTTKSEGVNTMDNERTGAGQDAAAGKETTTDLVLASQPTATNERERFAALKSAFPDDLEFAVAQYESGATVEQAKAAYAEVLRQRLAESKEENLALKSKLDSQAKASTEDEGADAVKHNEAATGDGADFMGVAKALAKDEKISMTEAMKKVAKEQPELHDKWKASIRPIRQKR